jgi:hypothetical protein
VIGRNYFTRQAATLLKFAKSTSDPQLAAGLLYKAAELKSHEAELPELSPLAPDIEMPDRMPLVPDIEPPADV